MMAATWDSLAKERSARVMLNPQGGLDGEHHEEVLHSGIDTPPEAERLD